MNLTIEHLYFVETCDVISARLTQDDNITEEGYEGVYLDATTVDGHILKYYLCELRKIYQDSSDQLPFPKFVNNYIKTGRNALCKEEAE